MNCVHCDCELNDIEQAFHHGGEPWCPQCFVWVCCPETTRFRAIECVVCKVISVDCTGGCGQCGKPVAIVLPQKVFSK